MKKFSINKILFGVAIFLVMFLTPFAVQAESAVNPSSSDTEFGNVRIYIHDNANILSSEDEAKLIKDVAPYCKKTKFNLNVLFLTVEDAQGKSTMTYTDDYMDQIFPVGIEDNIAFVIDMDNRKIYINTMGIAIQKLNDNDIERALSKGDSPIKSGKYAECLSKMATESFKLMGISRGFINKLIHGMIFSIPFALLIAVGVSIIMVVKHNKANVKECGMKYLEKDSYQIIDKREDYVRMYETRTKIKSNSSSSGGSSHRSSSGRSHGGGGHSF